MFSRRRMRWEDRYLRYQLLCRVEESDLKGKIRKVLEVKFGSVSEEQEIIEVQLENSKLQVRVDDLSDFTLITCNIVFSSSMPIEGMIKSGKDLLESDALQQAEQLAVLDIFAPRSVNEQDAVQKAEVWSKTIDKPFAGIGVAGGCVISVLEVPEKPERDYFLSPTDSAREINARGLDESLKEMRNIAVCLAQLARLQRNSANYFTAFKPGETEINERIDSFQWELLKPEPTKMETLESWLGYIMEREASLAAMISAMRSNRAEAAQTLSNIGDSFYRLNEASIPGYPRFSEAENKSNNSVIRKYDDFLAACESLKSRLRSVMENVRIYLSIQQQKLTLDEQKSSREQLERLVILQEIFHKVEIFVFAVYLTEMARMIFDAVAEDRSALFTAIFIPIALLLAVGFTRLLHSEKQK